MHSASARPPRYGEYDEFPKVVVEGLCKVFGNNPKQAIDMLAGGATKEEVFARTGQIVGVHNASFDVKEGEIFVLMGLCLPVPVRLGQVHADPADQPSGRSQCRQGPGSMAAT